MVTPDPSTLQKIKLKTEKEGWTCTWKCTSCDWTGEWVAARKDDEGFMETYCPECLAEATHIEIN